VRQLKKLAGLVRTTTIPLLPARAAQDGIRWQRLTRGQLFSPKRQVRFQVLLSFQFNLVREEYGRITWGTR